MLYLERYIPCLKKVYTFYPKSIYFLPKKYILFTRKVYTFLGQRIQRFKKHKKEDYNEERTRVVYETGVKPLSIIEWATFLYIFIYKSYENNNYQCNADIRRHNSRRSANKGRTVYQRRSRRNNSNDGASQPLRPQDWRRNS